MSNWKQIARKNQLLPDTDWKIWLILAGRGFGKTRAGAEGVLELITNKKAKYVGIMGETIFEARNLMIEGQSGLLSNSQLNYKYLSSQRKIIFENEAICQFFGADYFDKLRGFQFDLVWIDEFAKFKNCSEVFDQLMMCLRLGEAKMIITTTPQNKQILLKIMSRPDVHITRGTSFDNHSLSDQFHKNLSKYEGTNFGKQEIYGEMTENCLWNLGDIHYGISKNIVKYALGVDPAIENGTTGIILAGVDIAGTIFILNDYSISGQVEQWMLCIKELSDKYADLDIVIEVNQGGNLLIDLAKMYQINSKIIKKRAHHSKYERNIKLHILYQKKLVKHINVLTELENELLYNRKDRVDATYWVVMHLLEIDKVFSGFIC
jgi:phage terminase large subunit-like protein